MRILLTSGHNPFSALIKKLTGENASHIAIEWEEWVLHSNLNGVQWQSRSDFYKKADVLDEIYLENDLRRLLEFSAKYVDNGKYDVGALAFVGLRLALRGVGIRLPKKNLWRSTGMFMCTELISQYIYGSEDAMITPLKLFNKIKGTV